MQRVPVWKIVLIAAIILFSLWMLMPTLKFYSYDPVARNLEQPPELEEVQKLYEEKKIDASERKRRIDEVSHWFRNLKDDSIRLGLDLQGGVHMVIEVDMDKVRADIRQNDPSLDDEQVESKAEYALGSAAAIIENRVDQYGVAETALVRQPPNRLVLEMPGFSDPARVRDLVQATAELSFHLLPKPEELGQIIGDIDALVEEDFLTLFAEKTTGFSGLAVEDPDNVRLVSEILARKEVKSLIPGEYMFVWGAEEKPTEYYNFPHRYLYLLYSKTRLTGKSLKDAYVYFDPMTNQPNVSLQFDAKGANTFAQITGENVGERLAVVMDNRVYTAPRIEGEIRGGSARITGIGDREEARQIAVVLRAGAMPVPLSIAESRVVGPSLGADSINKGLMAGVIGGAVVIVFMAVYYAVTGIVADVAVILNLFLLLAGMAMFKATLTLPGIAGIVLTIGMAVDANVLIYERLREELQGKSKTIQLILDKGFGRAFMTIFDSNITTLITALVLFQFGTGPIKGFAVTLSLGILISMFTAVFVSRVILDVMFAYGMKTLNVGKIHFFGKTHINFFSYPITCLATTLSIGVIGFLYLAVFWSSFKGIDFAGGSEMLVAFQNQTDVQDVRSRLSSTGLQGAIIQEVLDSENQMLIRVREGEVESSQQFETKVKDALQADHPFTVLRTDTVGAKVGGELLLKAVYCIIFSSIGILLYITARFEFRFALAAVICLFHDLFFTLAILAFTGTEFNLPIVAALLTVLGYSLNDTIVVFDRIRENYTSKIMNFKELVNNSINQTLSRTVNTAMTTLFVLIALDLIGGSVIHDFSFTLLIGIVIGTYSSIFVASPLLFVLEKQGPKKVSKKMQPVS
ncbi:MAG: protein translocase subunit SecD [Candidatus Omnitrophota bacterium]